MTLTEGLIRDQIFLDGEDYMLGSDQLYVDYPCRFATVTFQLVATFLLSEIADRIRVDEGYKPMHAMDGFTDETCDNEGWYDFWISIEDYGATKVAPCIDFVVVNSDSLDNEETYSIDLTEEEQKLMYERLDGLCRQNYEKSCEELLQEARKEMEVKP